MGSKIVLLVLSVIFSQAVLAVATSASVNGDVLQDRIDTAIKSGYSVAECKQGSCVDYESRQAVTIDSSDRDGYYIYWDENKPREKLD